MTPNEAFNRAHVETCTIADEIRWDELPEELQLALGRVFKDSIQDELEEHYNEGYEHAVKARSNEVKLVALAGLRADVNLFFADKAEQLTKDM